MSERQFGWPSYLAILIGATVAFDLFFDVVGLSKASIGGIIFFVVCMIVFDFFSDDLPGMRERREGEK